MCIDEHKNMFLLLGGGEFQNLSIFSFVLFYLCFILLFYLLKSNFF
jgi:hypothetical protein